MYKLSFFYPTNIYCLTPPPCSHWRSYFPLLFFPSVYLLPQATRCTLPPILYIFCYIQSPLLYSLHIVLVTQIIIPFLIYFLCTDSPSIPTTIPLFFLSTQISPFPPLSMTLPSSSEKSQIRLVSLTTTYISSRAQVLSYWCDSPLDPIHTLVPPHNMTLYRRLGECSTIEAQLISGISIGICQNDTSGLRLHHWAHVLSRCAHRNRLLREGDESARGLPTKLTRVAQRHTLVLICIPRFSVFTQLARALLPRKRLINSLIRGSATGSRHVRSREIERDRERKRDKREGRREERERERETEPPPPLSVCVARVSPSTST